MFRRPWAFEHANRFLNWVKDLQPDESNFTDMDNTDTRFADRVDAGQQLAARLADMNLDRPIIFALPRGGVPVAAEIAERLKAPLDLILVRKIGAQNNPELALGAIAEGGDQEVIINEDVWMMTRTEPVYFNEAKAAQEEELVRRQERYLGDRARLDPKDRTVVVVDDGVATGATMKAALTALNKRGARRVIVALPVGPEDTLHGLSDMADDIVCLRRMVQFHGVGEFYRDFHQLSDDETVALLNRQDASS